MNYLQRLGENKEARAVCVLEEFPSLPMDAFSLEAMRKVLCHKEGKRQKRQTRDAAQARGGILSRTARAGPSRQLVGLGRLEPQESWMGGRAPFVRGLQPSARPHLLGTYR